jgi:hypothetical protein
VRFVKSAVARKVWEEEDEEDVDALAEASDEEEV